MPTFSTISFNQSGQALFRPEEIRELMRVEFDRAQRYHYAVACMMMTVDRLPDLQSVHGWESRDEVFGSLIELLKRETRSSDFLGALEGDRLLALFPHTSPDAANFLADRFLRGVRAFRFRGGGRTMRVSLSIGLSHNGHGGPLSFDTLVRVAEEGLAVADAGGGDRVVETELYQLYEAQRVRGVPELYALPEQREPLEDGIHRRRLLALVGEEGDLERAAARLAEEIMAQALSELEAESGPAAPQAATLPDEREKAYLREIENLQRRVNKLTRSLGLTEEELNRIRVLKNIDPGLASIYREVQGLSVEDAHAELKRELMARIFEANLDLQKKTG